MADRIRLLYVSTDARAGGLALDEDLRAVAQSLMVAQYGSAIELIPLPAARPADLVDAVMRYRPALLHLSGRGTPKDGLLFRADDGGEVPVDADGLAKVLAASPGLRLVTVTACWTRSLAVRLAEAVGCAIGIDGVIDDSASTGLSGTLYRAIANGYPVGGAHATATGALEMYGVPDHDRVALEHAPGIDPDLLFVVPAVAMLSGPRDAYKPTAATTLPLLRKAVTVVLSMDGTLDREAIEASVYGQLQGISEVRRITIRDD